MKKVNGRRMVVQLAVFLLVFCGTYILFHFAAGREQDFARMFLSGLFGAVVFIGIVNYRERLEKKGKK